MPKITIVDEKDTVIGSEERSIARAKGLRHRIARVFVLNSEGKVLLQKRSERLADNPGKWDQSAGGHVDEGEDYLMAIKRETFEELGIKPEVFIEIGKFYIEREISSGFLRRFQTIFTCTWNGPIHFAQAEVAEIDWFSSQEIDAWLARSPDDFTKN
ncbi:MAG: NUDIX domain-containing protein, partial [Patescibacteria group bacterium]